MTGLWPVGCLVGFSVGLGAYWALGFKERRLASWFLDAQERKPKRFDLHGTAGRRAALGLAVLAFFVSRVFGHKKIVSWLLLWPLVVTVNYVRGRSRASKRKESMDAHWPELLESMATTALAGVDLNTSFEAAARRIRGPLRQELDKVLARMASGQSLGQALFVLEKEVEAAGRLRSTLIKSEMLGTPLAEVLALLAQEHDTLRAVEMQRKFNALPLKLTVVTVVFLLPPVIIVSVMPHLLAFLDAGW